MDWPLVCGFDARVHIGMPACFASKCCAIEFVRSGPTSASGTALFALGGSG